MPMKVLKRILVAVLCVALLASSLVGCSSTGKKMIELEDSDINRPHIFNVLYCMMATYFKDSGKAS